MVLPPERSLAPGTGPGAIGRNPYGPLTRISSLLTPQKKAQSEWKNLPGLGLCRHEVRVAVGRQSPRLCACVFRGAITRGRGWLSSMDEKTRREEFPQLKGAPAAF